MHGKKYNKYQFNTHSYRYQTRNPHNAHYPHHYRTHHVRNPADLDSKHHQWKAKMLIQPLLTNQSNANVSLVPFAAIFAPPNQGVWEQMKTISICVTLTGASLMYPPELRNWDLALTVPKPSETKMSRYYLVKTTIKLFRYRKSASERVLFSTVLNTIPIGQKSLCRN